MSPISKTITKSGSDTVVVYGIDETFSNVSDPEVLCGDDNDFNLTDRNTVISRALSDKKNKDIGEDITIETQKGPKDYHIIAISELLAELDNVMYISLDNMESDFNITDVQMFVIKTSGDPDDVIDEINSTYNPEMNLYMLKNSDFKFSVLGEISSWFTSYYFLYILLVFMGIFILSSVYYNEIFSKGNDLKLLLGIGFDQKKIFRLFMIQGLIISLCAWIMGVVVGVFTVYSYLQWHLDPSYVFSFSFEPIITTFLVTFLLNLMILYFVSKKASKFSCILPSF